MPSITCLFAVKSSLFITFQKFPVFATGFSAGPIPAKHPPVFPLPRGVEEPSRLPCPAPIIPPARTPSQPVNRAAALPPSPGHHVPAVLSGAAFFRRSPPTCRSFLPVQPSAPPSLLPPTALGPALCPPPDPAKPWTCASQIRMFSEGWRMGVDNLYWRPPNRPALFPLPLPHRSPICW